MDVPTIGLRGYRVTNPKRMAERRRKILLAAARLFAEKGYHATTMDDIAEALGASKGVIYYQFRSKDEIIAELRVTLAEESIEDVERISARGEPPDTALRLALHALIEKSFHELNRHSILLRNPPDLAPEYRRRIQDAERRYVRLLYRILEDGMRQGLFVKRPLPATLHALIQAAFSVVFWYCPDGRLTKDQIVASLTDQLMASVLRHADGHPVRSPNLARHSQPSPPRGSSPPPAQRAHPTGRRRRPPPATPHGE
jgi:AcrR family transcriptional regulator